MPPFALGREVRVEGPPDGFGLIEGYAFCLRLPILRGLERQYRDAIRWVVVIAIMYLENDIGEIDC